MMDEKPKNMKLKKKGEEENLKKGEEELEKEGGRSEAERKREAEEEELTFLQSVHGGSHLSLLYTAWKKTALNQHVFFSLTFSLQHMASLPSHPYSSVATPSHTS